MTFLLGLLGVLQVAALPGLLILRLARWRGGLVETAALGFALSLLANAEVGLGLAALGLFSTPLVRALAALEIAALFWLYARELRVDGGELFRRSGSWLQAALDGWQAQLRTALAGSAPAGGLRLLLATVGAGVSLFALFWAANSLAAGLAGKVFNTWDAVLSWNRWAVEWTRGTVPLDLGTYPQLGPINWAVIYLLMGNTSVQFFARALMPAFFLLTLLLQADLGLERRSWGMLLGVGITYLAVRHFIGEFVSDGYMDMPAAFLGFLSLYLLLKISPSADPARVRRSLWFSALAAAAAALTKQTGLYILAAWPLLGWLLALRGGAGLSRRAVWLPWGLALALVALFYIPRLLVLAQGLDSDNTGYLVGTIHGDKSWLERAAVALAEMGRYAYLAGFALAAAAWQKPVYRWLTGVVLLPFLLIWGLLFSYDTRNITLALPLLGLLSGLGLEELVEKGLAWLPRLRFGWLKAWMLLGLGLAGVIALGLLLMPDAKLSAAQERAQREIFNPDLNRQLYAYIEQNGLAGRILTNYPVDYLPGLQGKQNSFWFNDLPVLLSEMKDTRNGYLLVPSGAGGEVAEAIEQRLARGELKLIFDAAGGYAYRFYKIVR